MRFTRICRANLEWRLIQRHFKGSCYYGVFLSFKREDTRITYILSFTHNIFTHTRMTKRHFVGFSKSIEDSNLSTFESFELVKIMECLRQDDRKKVVKNGHEAKFIQKILLNGLYSSFFTFF
ncbi:hypothetical protein HanPSC8_Chr17g0786831 [Helianthus annuus]|nr:hypothetical protein HanPSC8_Chr17g0786831 [Helianthus annuus]